MNYMTLITSEPDLGIVERTRPWQSWNCMMRFHQHQFDDIVVYCDRHKIDGPLNLVRDPIPYCYLHDDSREQVMFLFEIRNSRVEVEPSPILLGRANVVMTWKNGKIDILKDREGAHSWARSQKSRRQLLQTDIHLITKQYYI